jgi:hypothetical protein
MKSRALAMKSDTAKAAFERNAIIRIKAHLLFMFGVCPTVPALADLSATGL